MSTAGEIIFDRSSDNHEEVWDDTELIRAYDRAHRQIQNRLRNNSKIKKDSSINKNEKNFQANNKHKTKKADVKQSSTTMKCPIPMPINMITPPKNEQDAFHSMLMAWYMAGYHAGQLAAKNWKRDS
ncbi:unnamed protein product [Rotaria sp. Silwood2]|nr:unnamed protein product [Rotaria sp. Silwood2]CAF2918262.1 unnamed protein product [Rotaria sp. Silwood2]CAF4462865.1 unnamed protein product [Rotaria sp. Silwood2]CAF4473289.1 unnamed protein product [Rotaria sp. Silwood2]